MSCVSASRRRMSLLELLLFGIDPFGAAYLAHTSSMFVKQKLVSCLDKCRTGW